LREEIKVFQTLRTLRNLCVLCVKKLACTGRY